VVLLGASGFVAPELRRILGGDTIAVESIGRATIDLTAADSGTELAAKLDPRDAVVMAAGLTPDKGRDIETLMKNLRMGQSACFAVAQRPPAHFVYVSSDAVYDARTSSLLSEESSLEPTDLHAVAHIAREKMLEQTCRAAKVPLAIIRPCAIYGPGDTHNSYGPNRFLKSAKSGGKITLFGGGEERRHHIHVTDTAKIIQLCLLHRSSGIINAVTGEAVSFFSIADLIQRNMPLPVTIECQPRATPISHRHFDPTALVKSFPDFLPIPLEAGIAEMVEAVMAQ
jgi:nucleoside-diphosphate-sugar epimerase